MNTGVYCSQDRPLVNPMWHILLLWCLRMYGNALGEKANLDSQFENFLATWLQFLLSLCFMYYINGILST